MVILIPVGDANGAAAPQIRRPHHKTRACATRQHLRHCAGTGAVCLGGNREDAAVSPACEREGMADS